MSLLCRTAQQPGVSMNSQVSDTRAATGGEDVGVTRSIRSVWRYPSKPCSMPDYMRRAFRMKCFALVTLQLLCVFLIKMIVDHYRPWHEILDYGQLAYATQEIFFYASGVGTLICIAAMQCLREQYPWNYLMIGATTLVAGFFWGMMRSLVLTSMHFQILGILTVAMAVATVLSRQSLRLVSMPLLCLLAPGWIVGSCLCAFATCMWLEDPDQRILYASIGLSMLLLIILGMDAGTYLKDCNPDDFMKVIISMNSTLMVVVSIPFFVLSFCFVHANEALTAEVEPTAQPPAAAESAVAPGTVGETPMVEREAPETHEVINADLEQGIIEDDVQVARIFQESQEREAVYVMAA